MSLGPYAVEELPDRVRLARRPGISVDRLTIAYAPVMAGAIVLCACLGCGTAGRMIVSSVAGGVLLVLSLVSAQARVWRGLFVRPTVIEILAGDGGPRVAPAARGLTIDGTFFDLDQVRRIAVSHERTDDFEYFDVRIVMERFVVDLARFSDAEQGRKAASQLRTMLGEARFDEPTPAEEGRRFGAGAVVGSILFWVLGVLPASQIIAAVWSGRPWLAGLAASGVLIAGTAVFYVLYVVWSRRALVRYLDRGYGIR